MARRFALVGPGRAGRSMQSALVAVGWECVAVFGRDDDVRRAGHGVDVCIIATPDAQIASVASTIDSANAVLLHLSGATPLVALGEGQTGVLHPLVSLADSESGAVALRSAYFAVAGDPIANEIADALSGKWFVVDDADRPLYHAAAVVASNHLVALLGQVERIAAEIDVPVEAFMQLVRSSVDNVDSLGVAAALTGPAARGDEATIELHRQALTARLPDELAAYDALLAAARRLVPQAD